MWLDDIIGKYGDSGTAKYSTGPYEWGYAGANGTDVDGDGKIEYDCSNFVTKVLNDLGYNIKNEGTDNINLDHSKYYDQVGEADLQKGDVVLFDGHIGFFYGYDENGNMLVYSSSGNPRTGSDRGPAITPASWFKGSPKFLRPKYLIPNDAPDEPRDGFNDATKTKSPIVLDLDGNGIKTFGTDAGIHFDHDGNGFKELSGWIAGGDGLLMIDRNANNVLDSGNELFGNYTPLSDGKLAINGFQALTQFDVNGDGKIDADDPIWSQLRIWQHDPEATDLGDPDSSGIIKTLSELGIQSIDTGYTNANITDANGNIIKQTGTFTWEDGTTGTAADVWFQTDNMHTIANEWLDVPDDIATLPNMWGYGNVYDLHQAMVRDESGQLSDFWR